MKRRYYSVFVLFLIMMSLAYFENMRGVLVPTFKARFGVDSTHISLVLTLSSLAYIAMTFFAGHISEALGNRRLTDIVLVTALLGTLCLALSHAFWMYSLGMIFMSLALGLNGLGANVILPMLVVSMQAVFMNLLHFMYGLGATTAQRLTGYLLFRGVSYRTMYLATGAVFILLLLLMRGTDFPSVRLQEMKGGEVKSLLRKPLFWIIGLTIGSYVFSEQGIAIWLVDYLKNTQDLSVNQSSIYLSLFFLLLSIGRLLGGWVVNFLGEKVSLIGAMSVGFSLVFTGIFFQRYLLISLAGLFFSIVFPTMILVLQKSFKESSAKSLSLILTLGSLSNMVYNQMMGMLSDSLGYSRSIYLLPTTAGLTLVGLLMIFGSRKEKV